MLPLTMLRAVNRPFRLPIQYVNRPNQDFRGFAGTIASGTVHTGQAVVAAKSGRPSRVKGILVGAAERAVASAGQSVTLLLEDEIDISRGDVLTAVDARPEVADQFQASIVWFDEKPLLPGRSYILRTETDQAGATVTTLKHRINVTNFAKEAAHHLDMNEIGVCDLSVQAPIAFDRYGDNRVTGAFILVDRMTNATVAAGMIVHPLRRARNIHWQMLDVDRRQHAAQKHQKPAVLWFTGLSGSGKSTIANLLEKKLNLEGRHTYLLDGDNIRHGLNRDLGFTDEDRVENIRRVVEVARADGRRRAHRARFLHFAVPRRATDGARADGRRRVRRSLRRYAVRRMRAARSQRALRKGVKRCDQKLHWPRFAL